MRVRAIILAALLVGTLSACGDSDNVAEAPAPEDLTREAIGYYCNMIVADHTGPKGQIHVEGHEAPVWFSSVRDTVAFTMLPEEPKRLTAIYVNDMGRADWSGPANDTWIDARTAWYVVGSDKRGGMGALEIVPFSHSDAAHAFVMKHGGEVVGWAGISESNVLVSDVEAGDMSDHAMPPDEMVMDAQDKTTDKAADSSSHVNHME